MGGPVGYGADLGHLPAPAYPLQGAGPPSAPSARHTPSRTRAPDVGGVTRSAMAEVAAAGGGITAPATGSDEPISVTFNQVAAAAQRRERSGGSTPDTGSDEPIAVSFNQVAAAASRRERSGSGGSSAAASSAGSGGAPRRRRKKKHGSSRTGASSVCSSDGESENEDGAPARWTRPASAPTRAEDLSESSDEIKRFDKVAHAAAMEAAIAAEAAHAAEVKRRVSFGGSMLSPTRDPTEGDEEALDPVKIQKQLKAQRKLIAKQANQISSLIDRELNRQAASPGDSLGSARSTSAAEVAAPPPTPQSSAIGTPWRQGRDPSTAARSGSDSGARDDTASGSGSARRVGFGPAAGTSSSGGGEAKPSLAGVAAAARTASAFSGGGPAASSQAAGVEGAAARPARSAAVERARSARQATPPRRPDGTPRDQPYSSEREMPRWEHSGSAQPVPVAAPSPVERRSGGGGSSRAGGSAVGSAAGDKPRRKRRTGASSVASSQYGEMTI